MGEVPGEWRYAGAIGSPVLIEERGHGGWLSYRTASQWEAAYVAVDFLFRDWGSRAGGAEVGFGDNGNGLATLGQPDLEVGRKLRAGQEVKAGLVVGGLAQGAVGRRV